MGKKNRFSVLSLFILLSQTLFASEDTPNAVKSTWRNIYIGANVGAAVSSTDWLYLTSNPYHTSDSITTFNTSNVSGGFQLGFNYQIKNFVLSPEAAWYWSNLNKKIPNPEQPLLPTLQTLTNKLDDLFTASGRLGVLMSPKWMVYGKGGYANIRVFTSGITEPPYSVLDLNWSTAKSHNGWMAGGGLEYHYTTHISLAAEYNYMGFNPGTHIGEISGGDLTEDNQVAHDVTPTVQNIMFRCNVLLDDAL